MTKFRAKITQHNRQEPEYNPVSKNMNWEGIDPELKNLIQGVTISNDVVENTKPSFYYISDGDRKAKELNTLKQLDLLLVSNYIKSQFKNDVLLPDSLILIASSWFIAHLNRMNHKKVITFQKSVLVYTYNSFITDQLIELYWILRGMYFPNQALLNGPVEYENTEELHKFWKYFHLVSLTHLEDQDFSNQAFLISRQNNTLFNKRMPVIAIADPVQPEHPTLNLFTLKL